MAIALSDLLVYTSYLYVVQSMNKPLRVTVKRSKIKHKNIHKSSNIMKRYHCTVQTGVFTPLEQRLVTTSESD
jgi:hypothetical protein